MEEKIKLLRDWLKIHVDYNVMISLYDFDNYESRMTIYKQGQDIFTDTSEDIAFLLQLAIAYLRIKPVATMI